MKKVVSETPSKSSPADLNKENKNFRSTPQKNQASSRPCHKKSSSYQPNVSKFFSSPSKSRFDSTFIPELSINNYDLKSEISKILISKKKEEIEETRVNRLEWSSAKKIMKKSIDEESKLHQFALTEQMISMNKSLIEKENEKRKKRQQEKIESFIEFNKARKVKNEEKQEKDQQELCNERIKSIQTQLEILDKKERVKVEREEQRKSYLEFLKAKNKMKEEEKLREKKEMIYETNSRIFEQKNLLLSKSQF